MADGRAATAAHGLHHTREARGSLNGLQGGVEEEEEDGWRMASTTRVKPAAASMVCREGWRRRRRFKPSQPPHFNAQLNILLTLPSQTPHT